MTGFGWASRKGVGPHDSRRIRARFHRFAAIVIPKGPSDIYVRVCTISEFWLCFLGETVSPVALRQNACVLTVFCRVVEVERG